MKHSKNISIIGCGWLGLPLGKKLISLGYNVKGSTTQKAKTETLQCNGIKPYCIKIDSQGSHGNVQSFLQGSEIIIINIPPGLRKNPDKNHVEELKHLLEAVKASQIHKVIYISSTSVYADTPKIKTLVEEDVSPDASEIAEQLLAIEGLVMNIPQLKSTILRFGGLFGGKRHPAKYLSGKTNVKNAHAPVNLIHQADCIDIISKIIVQNVWGHVLNAVYPEHPTKKDYYTSYCKDNQLPIPKFDDSNDSIGKIVSSEKLIQLLDYRFENGI